MSFKLWLENQHQWQAGNPVTDQSGVPVIFYHGTNKRFDKFSLKHTTQGIIWFTSDLNSIIRGTAGAQGNGIIIHAHLNITNPAGWKEYGELMLDQFARDGFDGAILPDKSGCDAFVFQPSQIKIIKTELL